MGFHEMRDETRVRCSRCGEIDWRMPVELRRDVYQCFMCGARTETRAAVAAGVDRPPPMLRPINWLLRRVGFPVPT